MPKLYSNVRLRPTRIGFLVSPSDRNSVRRIMRANACLWGGQYNPIIPVMSSIPKDWKDKYNLLEKGREATEGYIKFFEPDVYVESKTGLLEKAGLGEFRKERIETNFVSLENFFDNEYKGIYEPAFGQSVFDLIEHTYLSERQFQLRDDNPAAYTSKENDVFSEMCIGVYPDDKKTEYFEKQYNDVFQPENITPNTKTWLKLFNNEFVTPFSVSNSHFETQRTWHDDPVIYVFNPSKTTDIIDLWNMRIQPPHIFPVPMNWLSELSENLRGFVDRNYRPLRNNRNGVMHKTTLEVSRSIPEEYAQDKIFPLFKGVKKGSLSFKLWRTSVWSIDYSNHDIVQSERIKITASEKDQFLEITGDNKDTTNFNALSPGFAERYSGSRNRWANVLSFRQSYEEADVATSLPYNTFDRSWPMYGLGEFGNGREGWVFLQNHKERNEYVSFFKQDEAFIEYFKRQGLTLELSEAGRIAKQMIESLGGFWGLYLFDDEISIKFVNKLATSTRIRNYKKTGEVIEEEFVGQSASIDQWTQMIGKRQSKGAHHLADLNQYIEKNVARLGLETNCNYCNAKNWHSLDEVSYDVTCTRCLKSYPFPQGNLKAKNKNWKYRVIGPFSVPDYAQGSYTALLTIRFFKNFIGEDINCTYSTAMDVVKDNLKTEVDFIIWKSDQTGYDTNGEPRLIIGEAKSFGHIAVSEDDIVHLKQTAKLMQESILVISVLKGSFSDEERKILTEFVDWTRNNNSYGPKHWVILLTGTELFDKDLSKAWKKLGEPFNNYTDYHSLRSFESLSNATLSIYLGLPSYYDWYEAKSKKKKRR